MKLYVDGKEVAVEEFVDLLRSFNDWDWTSWKDIIYIESTKGNCIYFAKTTTYEDTKILYDNRKE